MDDEYRLFNMYLEDSTSVDKQFVTDSLIKNSKDEISSLHLYSIVSFLKGEG
jgi:hypothetical protein